jgi:UDP-N-acetylmuramoyl-tripeptide--D-alanyl-D-alanine ligase
MSNKRWTLAQVSQATDGALHASPDLLLTAVCTDSRAIVPGCLFVALRGENFNGHAYVQEAVSQGAAAVLVDTPQTDLPYVLVKDTLRALGDFAHAVRRSIDKPVVAITGSNGKTTTKELTAQALSARGIVHRTPGNLNNLIGVPLTLFAWDEAAWAAVVEMGMNQIGEIARYTEIALPDVGLVTNIAAAHVGPLGSIENIALAKAELYAGLRPQAVAIFNNDDVLVQTICKPRSRAKRSIQFGTSAQCDVRVLDVEAKDSSLKMQIDCAGRIVSVHLPLVGRHNALNAAAALAVAHVLGVDVADAASKLSEVKLPDGRLHVVEHNGKHIIDDTYNANPASMQAALTTLRDLAKDQRKVAVLGSMFEQGAEAAKSHRQVGMMAYNVDCLLAVGEFAEAMANGAKEVGVPQTTACADVESACQMLLQQVQTDDWVLVKGSRGMRMERVVEFLQTF